MPALTNTRRTWLILTVLLLATAVIYVPVWRAQFLSVDDHAYVSDNTIVQQGLTWQGLKWAFVGTHVANYHPLTWLSHMLDCQLFGVDPRAAHAVNLIIHLANVALLFFVLRMMTGRELPSAVVAAVFALHPLHVESVAWVAERKDVLSGLFWMLTLGAYALYVRRQSRAWYAAALAAFALGLLAKPMVVTLPCVLLLLDVWPLGRTRWVAGEAREGASDVSTGGRPVRFLLIEKLPFFALSIASSIATMIAQSAGGAVLSMAQLPLRDRIGNAVVSYMRYARKFLFPSDLAAYYPLSRPWPGMWVLASIVALLIVTGAALYFSRKRPYLGVGWLWFLGTLVPVIGIVQVGSQAMADRYMYLPLVGLALIIVWAAAEFLSRRSLMIAGSACAALLAVVTLNDVRYWHDSETLFTRAIDRTEPSVFALHTVASSMITRGENKQAIEKLEECVKLQPSNPHVRRALGFALAQEKQYPRAMKQLAVCIHLDPMDGRSWNTMGHIYLDQKKWDAAAEHFDVALELNREDYDAHVNLAIADRQLGRQDAALEELRAALRLNATDAQPWHLYGSLLLECNQPAAAIEPLARAAKLDPRLADAQFRLGLALMRSGHGDRAVGPLMTAAQLSPQSPQPLAQLAWLLATHPDEKLRRGSDALFLAQQANKLTDAPTAETLDALAAALAEQQQFEEAARTADQAVERAKAGGDAALAAKVEAHARHFRDRQPVRDQTLAGGDAGEAVP